MEDKYLEGIGKRLKLVFVSNGVYIRLHQTLHEPPLCYVLFTLSIVASCSVVA